MTKSSPRYRSFRSKFQREFFSGLRAGENRQIPESLTRRYYEILLEEIRKNYARRTEGKA